MKPDIAAFLRELTDLSTKYNLVIGGCGCCGSPWIMELEHDDHGKAYTYTKQFGLKLDTPTE